jgi:4-amino-4-deoxy-L-arabinose transferase-like glycosyltransferase
MERVNTNTQFDTNIKVRFWQIVAVVTLTLIMAAAIRWSIDHPYGANYDETVYLDQVAIDTHLLVTGQLHKVVGRIAKPTWGRPPAYRFLAVPFLALFGFHSATARLLSLTCFALTAYFIYLTTRRIGSQAAGAFAVLVFSLSPQVVSASIWFSTEGPLYLATAAMLYYLCASRTDASERSHNWIGLGLAVALGFLSKASFAAIVIPAFTFPLIVDHWRRFSIPILPSILKASTIAIVIAGPWWALNIKPSMAYAEYARGFVRNSLGPPSLATWTRWFNTVLQSLLGYGLSILIALVLFAFVRKVIVQRKTTLDSLTKASLGVCACAGLPIVFVQLSGTNHLLRHISPAVIPLSIVVGVLADTSGWTSSRPGITVSSILLSAQLLMIVIPVLAPNKRLVDPGLVNGSLPWRIMARSDQWDWSAVKTISKACGVDNPKISYLGGARPFNEFQIQFPWAVEGSYIDVMELWRYEDGPIDWKKVMDEADRSDMVITAPDYIGQVSNRDNLDNQHNSEFADRLFQDPQFGKSIRLEMGRFEPIHVVVFVSKNLTCRP